MALAAPTGNPLTSLEDPGFIARRHPAARAPNGAMASELGGPVHASPRESRARGVDLVGKAAELDWDFSHACPLMYRQAVPRSTTGYTGGEVAAVVDLGQKLRSMFSSDNRYRCRRPL